MTESPKPDTPRGDTHPLWLSAGAAVFGVFLGGLAVFVGLRDAVNPANSNVAARGICTECGHVNESEARIAAIERTRDTVVTLESQATIGAGVIVDDKGTLLTNYHVVAQPSRFGNRPGQVLARFANGRILPAKLLWADEQQDLALLRLQPTEPETFSFAPSGASRALRVGEGVFAIGTPLGLENSIAAGIVSGIDRGDHTLPLIQLDAAINLGNSGGPLFNLRGELVGITTARAERGEGIAFAIPFDHINTVLQAVVQGQIRSAGEIGVMMSDEELPEAVFDLGFVNGVKVTKVIKNLPAQRAGLQVGDIVVEIGGRRYDSFGNGRAGNQKVLLELVSVVRSLIPGQELQLTVVRGDELVPLKIEVGAAPADRQIPGDTRDLLGLKVEKNHKSGHWHVVEFHVATSPVVREFKGARIKAIDGRRVETDQAFQAALRKLRSQGKRGVVVTLERADGIEANVPLFSRGSEPIMMQPPR